jgi:hypothetical protein
MDVYVRLSRVIGGERGLERLIRCAEGGATAGVMVYRIDRFGRGVHTMGGR